MILQTIKIKCDNELGYRIINLDDYIIDLDVAYDEVNQELQPVNIPTSKTRKSNLATSRSDNVASTQKVKTV